MLLILPLRGASFGKKISPFGLGSPAASCRQLSCLKTLLSLVFIAAHGLDDNEGPLDENRRPAGKYLFLFFRGTIE